jgi:hypothetical protein
LKKSEIDNCVNHDFDSEIPSHLLIFSLFSSHFEATSIYIRKKVSLIFNWFMCLQSLHITIVIKKVLIQHKFSEVEIWFRDLSNFWESTIIKMFALLFHGIINSLLLALFRENLYDNLLFVACKCLIFIVHYKGGLSISRNLLNLGNVHQKILKNWRWNVCDVKIMKKVQLKVKNKFLNNRITSLNIVLCINTIIK